MALSPTTNPAGGAALGRSGTESNVSAVSWAAVLAGAVVGAALALILLALGAGLGFSSISPWQGQGASASTFTLAAAAWLIIVQIVASGLGGYLAGRLRTKWSDVNADEVHFRDTAHGFLSWAVGALIGAALLGSAAASAVGGGAQLASGALSGLGGAAGAAASQAAGSGGGTGGDAVGYFSDRLFRSDRPAPNASEGDSRAEIGRVLGRSLAQGSLAADDRTYIAQAVAARTGLSQPDAEKRVDEVTAQAKDAAAKAETAARQAAEAARKAAMAISLWTFIALLIGAFSATLAATWGGRARIRASI